tara:strand:- start:125 stop:433 length:309 start_codon:yes stop_codon:yes gene_type:complete
MKNLFITLFLITAAFSVQGSEEQKKEVVEKLERIERLSVIVKKRLHPEVVDSLTASEIEVISERLSAQEEELKRMDKQLRNQFNNLDVDAQRDILLRQVKKD